MEIKQQKEQRIQKKNSKEEQSKRKSPLSETENEEDFLSDMEVYCILTGQNIDDNFFVSGNEIVINEEAFRNEYNLRKN